MDPTKDSIEVAAARWEQWLCAAMRAERCRALKASARPPRRSTRAQRVRPRIRAGLLWLLVVSVAGYWLLR